jgi:hypothetical protein
VGKGIPFVGKHFIFFHMAPTENKTIASVDFDFIAFAEPL